METKIQFTYDNQRLTRVSGSFVNIPQGTVLYNPQFSADTYDSIVHLENQVRVYTKPPTAFYSNDDPENPIKYVFDDDQNLTSITLRNGVQLVYEKTDNLIVESIEPGEVRRKFHMENNNLARVESENINLSGELVGRKEIVFSNYDSNPNPFKGMYYITGAFYRSFSNNNYSKMTITEYTKIDGEFIVTFEFTKEFDFEYYNSGYPKFGNY